MKKLTLILIAFVLGSASFGQSQLKLVKERVGTMDIVRDWQVGAIKEANGVKILRVEGEGSVDYRTNVFYIPQVRLLADINQKAATEPVYNMELEQLNDFYSNEYAGGQVAIFFDRLSADLANPANFTVIIIDPATNQEIYRTTLEYQAPYSYKWGVWYYYTVINIPSTLGEKFIVRVLDEGLQQTSEFLVYDNFTPPPPSGPVITTR